MLRRMVWRCISPLRSEDVIPAARDFVRRGVTNPQTIRNQLTGRGWEDSSVWAVIRQVERTTRSSEW